MIGQQVSSYRLVRQIGEGGMGAVYEAFNEQLGKRAAIKLLHADLSRDPEIAKRFLNEARAVNLIDHPGVVNVFEFGQREDGSAYIVMELLAGETLWDRLERLVGSIELGDALRIVRQVASALQAAHDKEIVHRDLKPANIMLVPDPEAPGGERVKLMDFGIAKLAEEYQLQTTRRPVRTHTGVVMGTPVYIAPEQARGARRVTTQADVYSLGVVLYEMLAARPPFVAEGTGELLGMHIFQAPPPLLEVAPQVPEEVAALVHRMLEKDADKRPVMAEVIAQLEALGAPKASGGHGLLPGGALRRDRSGAAAVNPYSSTLGGASGQTHPPAPKRGLRVAAAAVGFAALGALAGGLLRSRPPAPMVVRAAAPVPAAPARIRLSVTTSPPGADVVQLPDGVLLGQTPFEQDRAQGTGTVTVALRREGFQERQLGLDTSQSVTHEILLQREPAAPAPMVPASASRTAKSGQKANVAKTGPPPRASAAPPPRAPAAPAPSGPETTPPAPTKKSPSPMEDFGKLDPGK